MAADRKGRTAPAWLRWLLAAGVGLSLLLMLGPGLRATTAGTAMTYTDFVAKVDAGQVRTVSIDGNGAVRGALTSGGTFTTQVPTALNPVGLDRDLNDHHVQVTATPGGTSWWAALLGWLPLIAIVGLLFWGARRAQRQLVGGAGGFGRSRARIIEAERPATRFSDVAGYAGVKQEVGEIVDFLRDPGRYAAAGATGPRGVVMIGPPGTGKTLIARAVAGEAEVPFLSVTGSAFVEMFVGVGASRVRDLFAEARTRAPAIIFIDEIDAIGGRRGAAVAGGHEEREQTLNQLLAEMDGFDQSAGIVVLAATNRPETLDRALLRPGRFDRQVVVPLPSQAERAAILAVHAGGKHLDPGVRLERVARGTPGFSGADLANLLNEAAINAVRDGRTVLTAADLDAARERVLLGRRDTSHALLPAERRAVAVHESGHALAAALCAHADPVDRVSILPAGLSLGVTEQLPECERRLYREDYLTDLLTVRLAGRAAELLVFGQGSSGAADDLAGATQVAARMVVEFGLSPAVGPVGYGTGHASFLGEADEEPARRPYSEATQRLIDEEIATLLRRAETRAVDLLRTHRDALDRLADLLIERETVDGDTVRQVLSAGRPAPRAAA